MHKSREEWEVEISQPQQVGTKGWWPGFLIQDFFYFYFLNLFFSETNIQKINFGR